MQQVFTAVFENGVFKPIQHIEMKEHEEVTMKVVSRDDWQSRFDRIIKKIHQKSTLQGSAVIESDIVRAIAEVREEKNGR
ncbi:MAG: antitoxin family protein [Syntrophales bacterium]|nr:antitoxin family protein [Syntrophales bacterium]